VWRAVRTPITLAVLIGALVGGAVWGYRMVVTGVRPVQPAPCVVLAMPELTPSSVVVRVYNGGSVRGLANAVAKELRSQGYIVAAVGNTKEIVNQTVIVGVAVDSPEVQLVASQFLQPELRADGRIDHTVDILVGEAEAPRGQDPLASVPLEAGSVCIAPAAVPSPAPTDDEGEDGPPEGEGAEGENGGEPGNEGDEGGGLAARRQTTGLASQLDPSTGRPPAGRLDRQRPLTKMNNQVILTRARRLPSTRTTGAGGSPRLTVAPQHEDGGGAADCEQGHAGKQPRRDGTGVVLRVRSAGTRRGRGGGGCRARPGRR
jgi:hypothetical protein